VTTVRYFKQNKFVRRWRQNRPSRDMKRMKYDTARSDTLRLPGSPHIVWQLKRRRPAFLAVNASRLAAGSANQKGRHITVYLQYHSISMNSYCEANFCVVCPLTTAVLFCFNWAGVLYRVVLLTKPSLPYKVFGGFSGATPISPYFLSLNIHFCYSGLSYVQ
jgi:hypothetical protein